MPFKSKEQERYLQINEPEIYQDWVEKYGRFKGAESFNAQNEKRSKYMNEKRSKYMDYIYDMFYTPDSDAYKLREIRYPKLKGQEHQIASQVKNAFDKRQSPFDSVLHNNLKGLSMTRQPFYYHIPYKGKLFVFSYMVSGRGRLKQGYHTYYPPDSQFGEEQICGLETKHGDECYCYRKNYKSESFSAEDDMIICEGCNMERYSDVDFTIDNAREDVLDDGDVLCDYCWASHDKYVENAESFAATTGKRMYCPACQTNRTWMTGYKKREMDYTKGERPQDFRFYVCNTCEYAYDPKTSLEIKNWKIKYYGAESFEADVEKCPKCDSGNLGKEEMYYCYTCGNDDASEDGCSKCGSDTVGEEEMDYCYTCGGHGHWFNAESFSADNYEELITTCPYCEGVKIDDHDKYELVECFKRYLEDSTPHPDKRVMMLKKKAESFGAENMPYPEAQVTNIVRVKDKAYVTIRYPDTDEYYGYEKILVGDMEDVMLAESFGAENMPYPEAQVTNIVRVKDKAYVTIRYPDTDEHYGYEKIMEVDMEDVMLAESFGAESYDSALVHLKSLMPINRDSYLRNFRPSELTHSSTNQINFNQASVNYSAEGSRAESFAANPQGRPYCEPCAERGFNYYGAGTCGDCGYIKCKRCLGDGENCKSCEEVKCENCGDMESSDWIFTTPHGEFCVDCRNAWIEDPDAHNAESFRSYKVAPDLSSYTKAELVSSIAGPQGTAAYDEVVYDPVAQSRLSAESIDSFSPARLIVLGASIGVALGLYNTRRD